MSLVRNGCVFGQKLIFSQKLTIGVIYKTRSSNNFVNNVKMSTLTGKTVFVTRRVPEKGIGYLKARGCHVTQWNRDDPITKADLVKGVKGVDALFCLLTDNIDKEVMDAAGPQLKVIGTMSVGYDHVDLQECKKRGIPLGYTPDVLTDATAELTVALLLATARRLIEGVHAVKSGQWGTWAPLWLCGPTLSNSTVGIVGLGRIGLAVGKRLQPFGVKTFLYNSRSETPYAKEIGAEFVNLDDLLSRSDFVIATCALTDETKGMFNSEAFKKMKPSAMFINTSRGGVVQQEDLYNALKDGEIRAAGLDVTVPEPLPTDSPLLTLDNCVVLPHIASATDETRAEMSELCARNIIAALDGEEMPAKVNIS